MKIACERILAWQTGGRKAYVHLDMSLKLVVSVF